MDLGQRGYIDNRLLNKAIKHNFNPIIFADQPDGTVLLNYKVGHMSYFMEVIGGEIEMIDTDNAGSQDKPYIGAEIFKKLGDKLDSISVNHDDRYYFKKTNKIVFAIIDTDNLTTINEMVEDEKILETMKKYSDLSFILEGK